MAEATPKILGAIIAGGKSRRFGSDKTVAELQGKPLIQHVIDELTPQCDKLVICGRNWKDHVMLADRPHNDMGPLAGLCAALHFAAENGFDYVYSAACDVLPVANASAFSEYGTTEGGARYIQGHYLSGIWPARLSLLLDIHLAATSDFSIRKWIEISGALPCDDPRQSSNLNTAADFAIYLASRL